ncbi:hypothetical protein [Ruminococcus sp. RTP21484sp1]|uniref:tetratricopeptide repeat protein n=1 Tax=Ruminococcus sp. RTP21484sp1 TaxID=3151395 RepID=UPI00321AFAA0
MRSQDVFKNAIMTVCKDLGLLERELAVCIKIDKTVLSRFKTKPYKWIKEIDRRLVLLALYFGEEAVKSVDVFEKRIYQVFSSEPHVEKYENCEMIKNINDELKDDGFDEICKEAFKIVRGRLQDLDEDKVKATNADREKIRERISLKFPKQVEIYEKGKETGEIEVKVDSTLSENQIVAEADSVLAENQTAVEADSVLAENQTATEADSILAEDQTAVEADSVLAENQTAAEADSVLPENQTTVEADNGLMEKQAVESVQNNKTDEASEAIPLDEYSQVQREAEKEYKAACVMATHDEEYIQHMLRAAELGHRDAKYYLGVAYMDGDNVIRDPEKAVTYFFEAGKMGSINAVYKLKICYAEGIGVEKNERNATWLLRILRKNHYQPDSPTVDISLDPKVKLANNYKKEFKEFIPETLNDRKLQELVLIWKNKI